MDAIDDIEQLFARHGDRLYEGQLREAVTALEHSLQCAQLAEWARADSALVAAALLHDIGHFVEQSVGDQVDDEHEQRAAAMLASSFPPSVVEPVRLHVQAKRYLVATDDQYLAGLSSASVHSLSLQGGPMSADECARFEAMPHAEGAVLLRRWDDSAKTPGRKTPSLAYYLALLREVSTAGGSKGPRTVVGSPDV
jgi:phosphonate degradation associated HDIG domain protein